MYEGVVGISGLIMWLRNDETCSVGPLQPLTNLIVVRRELHIYVFFLGKRTCYKQGPGPAG